MAMKDAEDKRESFIYDLSRKEGPEWFEEVILVSSPMDSYSPYYSSRVQVSKQNVKPGSEEEKVFEEMVENITSRVKGNLRRVDVCMKFEKSNVDTFTGKAAHIYVVSGGVLLEILSMLYSKYL